MSTDDTGAAVNGGAAGWGRVQYAGAVYGSLLAASVVAGSTAEGEPPPAAELMALLICTGVVFWMAHVYAEIVSHGLPGGRLNRAEMRAAANRQWPLAQASLPPSVTAVFVSAFGGSDTAAAWAALGVAVVSQVTWSVAAARQGGATRGVVVLSGTANLVLGLVIVTLKTMVGH
jgi:hypothetical protein